MHLKNKKISIVGGGLVGSLLSIYLSKQGANVRVFDKRSDLRSDLSSSGRSINLALSDRGIQALKKVGISEQILKISMPMYKRMIHAIDSNITEQPYGKQDQAIYSVSRKELNIKLIDLAEDHSVNFFFQKECLSLDVNTNYLKFKNLEYSNSDFIFGADGAGSIVRKTMSNSFNDINIIEEFIDFGYKELTIPASIYGKHKLENNALHIWPRKSYMVIALPNLDGTFTCTLFAPLKGRNSFSELVDEAEVNDFFATNFNDLNLLIPNICEQYFNNPQSSLGFVRSNLWKKNNTILIGDACHATVPFYGQGMNSGFEDCFLLNEWLDKNGDLSNLDLSDFLNNRILDTRAMQDLSMHNFIEMRDKTASRKFLLQKEIEQWFSYLYPEKWTPLYSMVTFSHIRYSEAIKRGIFQDKIMKEVMLSNDLNSNFSIQELETKNIAEKILLKIDNFTI